MRGMDDRWKLIERLATEMGVSSFAIEKWRKRGVPYRFHLPLLRAAARIGESLTDTDFRREAA